MTTAKLIALRVPDALLKRIDAHCERLRQLTGIEPSRSDVIRLFIEQGLTAAESGASPSRKR